MEILSNSLTKSIAKEVLKHQSLSVTLLIATSAFIAVRYIRSPWRKVPPGPWGLPIIGGALNVFGQPWLTFTKWKKTYGDLVFFTALGKPMLVINSQQAARDLLDRRAGIYSDRAPNIVASDMLTGGLLISLIGYNDMWRRMRKASHESLHKGNVASFFQIQTNEALICARDTLAKPDLWYKSLRRSAASVSMSVVYDTPSIESEEDKSVTLINEMVERAARAAAPGSHFVEFLPFLKAIPSSFAKWKREAEKWYTHDSVMFEGLFEDVRARVASGDERPSFSANLIKNADRYGLTLRHNAWLSAAIYGAGAETTSSVLSWWMLAMVLYPDVQKRAHAELDRVVGRDRLPSFADLENLPYIWAMVHEALRWRSSFPIGLPHRLTQDDWYRGYFIPKGTVVIANAWYINRDPDTFGADVEEFNPARHLGSKEANHVTFGFGKRICAGRHIANHSLFINMAMTLWGMNIERHLDANGKPTPIDVDGCTDNGIVVSPVPFQCKITARFPEALAILEHERELLGST